MGRFIALVAIFLVAIMAGCDIPVEEAPLIDTDVAVTPEEEMDKAKMPEGAIYSGKRWCFLGVSPLHWSYLT